MGIEEDDEVDIGGIIELAPAVLAEREDHRAGAAAGIVGIGQRQLARLRRLDEEDVRAARDRGVREIGERGDDLVHAPGAADIGERDEERVLGPRLPHEPRHLLAPDFAARERLPAIALGGDDARVPRLRALEEEPRQPLGTRGEPREEGGMLEQKAEEIAHRPRLEMRRERGRRLALPRRGHEIVEPRPRDLGRAGRTGGGEAMEEGGVCHCELA